MSGKQFEQQQRVAIVENANEIGFSGESPIQNSEESQGQTSQFQLIRQWAYATAIYRKICAKFPLIHRNAESYCFCPN